MRVVFDGNGPTGGMGNFNWFAVQPLYGIGSVSVWPRCDSGADPDGELRQWGQRDGLLEQQQRRTMAARITGPGETVYIEDLLRHRRRIRCGIH